MTKRFNVFCRFTAKNQNNIFGTTNVFFTNALTLIMIQTCFIRQNLTRHETALQKIHGRRYAFKSRKQAVEHAKSVLLQCERHAFTMRNTAFHKAKYAVYEAKHGDLWPFGRVFNLSKVKGETASLHNSLNINQIRINTRNASFSIVNVFWGVRLQKVRQIC